MRFGAVVLLLCLSGPALGQESEAEDTGQEMTPEMAKAEYNRLSEEMQGLAGRNAWSGVERFYKLLVNTGVDLEFDELVTGAHSARASGDTKTMRDRLAEASKLREARDVIEWMWEIDAAYGPVFLACDVDKKKQPELAIADKPFDPNHARSVDFAVAQLAESCLFDGMLPKGSYTFGPHTFDVVPKLESIRIDMRSTVEPSALVESEKPERAAKKK